MSGIMGRMEGAAVYVEIPGGGQEMRHISE
jgi:hypothetical protein